MTDRDQLLEQLNASRDEFLAAIEGVTDRQAAVRPSPGWSVLDCAEHVALTEDNLHRRLMESTATAQEMPREREARIAARVTDRGKKFQAPEFVRPGERFPTLSAAVESFCRSREQTIAYIASCQADLRYLAMEHPLIGTVSGQEMILMLIGHPVRHAEQIREVRALLPAE